MSKKSKILTAPLHKMGAFLSCKEAIENKENIMISGIVDALKAPFISSLSKSKTTFVIAHSEREAKRLVEDFKFADREAFYYPAKDVIFYFADVHSEEIAHRRVAIFKRILDKKDSIIVLSADALLDKLIPLKVFKKGIITFEVGKENDLSSLGKNLLEIGYKRVDIVENKGQFRIQGGILDIFPVTEETMYRVEFFDDEVDSIRDVNIETKRSNEKHDKIVVYPASEFVISDRDVHRAKKCLEKDYKDTLESLKNADDDTLASLEEHYEELSVNISSSINYNGIEGSISYYYDEMISVLDIVKNSTIFVDEPSRVKERLEFLLEEYAESMKERYLSGKALLAQMDVIFKYGEVVSILEDKPSVQLSSLIMKSDFLRTDTFAEVFARQIEAYHNKYAELISDLKSYIEKDYKIVLLSPSMTRARRLATMLEDDGIRAYTSRDEEMFLYSGAALLSYGSLSAGFDIPELKYLVITEADISANNKKKKLRKYTEGIKISSFEELKAGDYVVHEEHGIGVFDKIERIKIDDIEKDFIKINYAGTDNLYISIANLDLIRKYLSKEGKKPKLNKLGSKEWIRTKTKVKEAIEEVAQELVELYAKRQSLKGFVYSKDTSWEKEFEEAFPYEETTDQILAIEDTKRDMQSDKIMDRLICGDVGYGKTEVAIRAAFKAVGDGKQVAYLVPTTILAQQHYNNFVERMKDYPVNIELMSRFRSKNEQKETIKGINNGSVEIVIGTHRLLSKDVKFKDLGLLIIDEEQRFGVRHKEKIKEVKNTVDVLTLTATPIPRTLNMSLIGIRDMSVLTHPPHERVPVRTYVLEKSDEIVRDAIRRELKRNGQVFYVYNKVKDIDEISYKLSELVPEARITYAHGQMSERELENVMLDFVNKEIDVLVATTIIETGLDIRNANAIIIDDAHRLGLSQLYQLRGRVGRSNREAFAYLLYKKDVVLKEEASKRLEAIKQFTQFGAGYKIAMKDLEIRGAGNILGKSQSGHRAAIGYELYVKMLEERVRQLRNEEAEAYDEDIQVNIDIKVDGYIPNSYIENEIEKIEIYKKIALIDSDDEKDDLEDELVDRFGDMPKSTENLFKMARYRYIAKRLKIIEIKTHKDFYEFVLLNDAPIDATRMVELSRKHGRRFKFKVGSVSRFLLDFKPKVNILDDIDEFLADLLGIVKKD